MLTNKDYDRLTLQHDRRRGMICGVGVKANSEEIVERLYTLEEMIESGKLMFLPCKVGDDFWCFAEYYSLSDGWETLIAKHTVNEIRILNNVIYLYDENDEEYDTSDIILFFTEEAVKKALERLEK